MNPAPFSTGVGWVKRCGMKLIAGLGNPGEKYVNSRHNIGFQVVEKLAHKYNAKLKRKFFKKARQANLSIFADRVIALKPLTYMNLSGSCILDFCENFNLDLKDILIVCDDINLPVGKIRIRPSGSAGGHNGLDSIIESLGSDEFPRLRMGIKTAQPVEDLSEYVLSEFKSDEEMIIEQVIDRAVSACEDWIKNDIEAVMNNYN